MEENINKIGEKPGEEKSQKPGLRPSAPGVTITPVSPPAPVSSAPTTPLPRVSTPPPAIGGAPMPTREEKKDRATVLLLLAVVFNIISLLILISIGLDKTPSFLARFF